MLRALVFFLILLPAAQLPAAEPLPGAHAHNDYEHPRPLFDALDAGFTSVEADVHLIDGVLYVYHDRPRRPDPLRTLQALYLEPLLALVEKQGSVYPGYQPPFLLMIDLKTGFEPTYTALTELLWHYEAMLCRVIDGKLEQGRAVRVFLSGTASENPYHFVDSPQLVAGVDGRPHHLGKGIPADVMPVVSDSFYRVSSWRANDEPNARQWRELHAFAEAAHAEGKRARLWAAPDHALGWRVLQEAGIDLINSDELKGLSAFLREPTPE